MRLGANREMSGARHSTAMSLKMKRTKSRQLHSALAAAKLDLLFWVCMPPLFSGVPAPTFVARSPLFSSRPPLLIGCSFRSNRMGFNPDIPNPDWVAERTPLPGCEGPLSWEALKEIIESKSYDELLKLTRADDVRVRCSLPACGEGCKPVTSTHSRARCYVLILIRTCRRCTGPSEPR